MALNFEELVSFAQSADGEAVRRFLQQSLQPVTPKEMLDIFTWATVGFVVEGDFGTFNGYDLARKLRGALWPFLTQEASDSAKQGLPCTKTPVCLLDLLWSDAGRLPRGREIPKPWVLRASDPVRVPNGRSQSVVQLVLFGLAATFCEDVAAVLAKAIEGGLRDGSRLQKWHIIDHEILVDEGIDLFQPSKKISLRLLSPLKLSSNGAIALNYGTLLETLVDRIEGLGLWHGVKLSCDFRDIRARARNVVINDDRSDIGRWTRHSSRTNRLIPMVDTRGAIELSGDFSGLEPFLTLLPIVHVGKDTRHGHGWCELSD